MSIQKSSIQFLNQIKTNNNRGWFLENKDAYEKALKDFKSFVKALERDMSVFDVLDKTKIFRIYRDVRFSQDKTPYKTYFAANLKRLGAERRGGYYLRISAEDVLIAGGFWNPNSQDLGYIRERLDSSAADLRSVINKDAFKKAFGELEGEEVKTAPRGFSIDHESLDLIRKKQFIVSKSFPIEDVYKDSFSKVLANHFQLMIPFFDVMTEMLVFDGNGVPRT